MSTNPLIALRFLIRSEAQAVALRCSPLTILFTAVGLGLFSVSSLRAVPPPNDNFANRITLTAGVTAITDTTDATIEPGEPAPRDAGDTPNRTAWYTWTASADSKITLDNIGSEIQDDYLAVYLGSSLGGLVDVSWGYVFLTGGPGGRVQLSFPVKAGTILQIQAGSVGGGKGKLQVTLNTNPFDHAGELFGPQAIAARSLANDNFINRTLVTGSTWTALSYTLDATIEGGEPNRPFDDVSNTVWYKWTAPSSSNVTIDTTGTSFSRHFFAVYAGDSIQALAPVAAGSSSSASPTASTFPVREGVTYTIAAGSTRNTAGTLVLTLTSAPPHTGSLLNLSTRMAVGTGNDVLIGGFIITGGQKHVVIRGIGPSLTQFGISNALSDPFLELHDGNGALVSQNNNWQDDPNQAGAIQGSGLAPSDPRESALLMTLPAGNHTAVMRGLNNTTGVALVEVYDTEGAGAPAKAANVATRGFVSTGNSVMIAGFIVGGNSPAHLIIRGIGPSLANFGVINALQNPQLELYNENGNKLVTVDNWQDASNYGQVVAAGLAPSDLRESAISGIFNPGNYTAVLRGLNNTTGVGLVEVYNILP